MRERERQRQQKKQRERTMLGLAPLSFLEDPTSFPSYERGFKTHYCFGAFPQEVLRSSGGFSIFKAVGVLKASFTLGVLALNTEQL